MANGAHGQWGLWAMGPMGDWNIFAHSIIITGWILTKILLDIHINVLLSKYRAIFPRWLHLSHIFNGFWKFCLLAGGLLLAQIASLSMQWWRHCACALPNSAISVTKNSIENSALGKPFHFEFSNSNNSIITEYFKSSFWLLVDNNYIYIVPKCQPPTPPTNTQTEVPPDQHVHVPTCPNMIHGKIFKNHS